MPIEEAIPIARQVAEALEAAHEAGIVHRDLKPANIRIRPDGTVKVLDFGLAKAWETGGTSSSPSLSPTVTRHATIEGVILGTAAYMAPEQARGRPVDKRADIWAFGVVFYEMLTGRHLFDGETVSDVLAAVLTHEVDLDALPPLTPAAIRQLLRRCLERNRRNRLHDIADARIVLDEAMLGAPEESMRGPASRSRSRIALVSAVVGAVLAIAVAALLRVLTSGSPAPPIRAMVDLPSSLALVSMDRSLALSPDGSQVALVATETATEVSRIYLRALDRLELRALEGTEGATYPFWSPEGRALGFFADRKLKRFDLEDGIVRTLCDAAQGRGASWGSRDVIVFAPGATGPLFQVPASGGTPAPFTTLLHEGEEHRLPHFLPGGRAILFKATNRGAAGEQAVYAFDPGRGAARKVLDTDTEALYVEPGYMVFVQDENLLAQPFDADRFELSGAPKPIAGSVAHDANRNFLNLGISAGGRLVYQEVTQQPGVQLYWLDRQGAETEVPVEPAAIGEARLSPDSRRAVLTVIGDDFASTLGVVDLERGVRTPFRVDRTGGTETAWSPDGQRIAFASILNGEDQMQIAQSRSREEPVALTNGPGREHILGSFTPDGRQILFASYSNLDKKGDLFVVDADGGTPPRPFLSGPSSDTMPRLSPDGRWAGFITFPPGRDTGRGELCVADFPAAGGRWQITREGVAPNFWYPAWGWLDDRELYWMGLDARVWSIAFSLRGGEPEFGSPRPLFHGQPLPAGTLMFDYSRERQQFLIGRRNAPPAAPRVVVVSDWRRTAGAGGLRP